MDATVALMAALRARLLADGELPAITGKIFDRPPANEATPYLTIGETSYEDWSTSDTDGQNIRVDIGVWQEPAGADPDTRVVRALMGHVRRIVHLAPLDLGAHNLVLVRVERAVGPMLDPDGYTLHGVVTVRALTGHAAP